MHPTDLKLVEEVQKYPNLYDACSPHYRGSRAETWTSISAVVGLGVPECSRRWKYLRDTYVRHRRDSAQASGKTALAVCQMLSWLTPYLHRETDATCEDMTAKGTNIPALESKLNETDWDSHNTPELQLESNHLLDHPIEDLQKRLEDKESHVKEANKAKGNNILALESKLKDTEWASHHVQQVDSNHLLQLQVEDLQKRLEDKERDLKEANEIIRALRAEVQTLHQQLKQQKRRHQEVIGQQDRDCHTREGEVESSQLLKVTQTRNPCRKRSTYDSKAKLCPPNLILSCTSDDDSGDPAIPSSDEVVGVSHQAHLGDVVIKLENISHLVDTNGIFRITTVDEANKGELHHEEDDNDDDDGPVTDVRDSDYDPTNEELESFSDKEDPIFEPAKKRKGPRINREKAKPTKTQQKQHTCEDYGKNLSNLSKLHQRKEKNGETGTACSYCGKVFIYIKSLHKHLKNAHLSEPAFECSHCQEKFATLASLKIHKRIHKIMHECEECGKKFPSSSALLKHKLSHSDKQTHFCTKCNKGFKHNYYVRVHQRFCGVSSSESTLVCKKCNKCFKRKSSLSDHQKWCGTNSNEWPFSCIRCNKHFKRGTALTEHQWQCAPDLYETPNVSNDTSQSPSLVSVNLPSHSESRPFICARCNKSFKSEIVLKDHQKRCVQYRPYQCTICSKKFGRLGYFRLHVQLHSGERPFSCHVCSKTFSTKQYLKNHELVHTGSHKRSYQCEYCTKSFPFSTALRFHKRIHTGEKPYTCTYCSKPFSRYGQLYRHLRTHTGERPHKCSVCEKTFSSISTLKDHTRSHTRERPFLCSFCGKAFLRRDALKAHQRRHTGEKPYTCATCGEKFVHKQTMWAHEKKEHGIDRSYPCTWCKKTFKSYLDLKSHACAGPGNEDSTDG